MTWLITARAFQAIGSASVSTSHLIYVTSLLMTQVILLDIPICMSRQVKQVLKIISSHQQSHQVYIIVADSVPLDKRASYVG